MDHEKDEKWSNRVKTWKEGNRTYREEMATSARMAKEVKYSSATLYTLSNIVLFLKMILNTFHRSDDMRVAYRVFYICFLPVLKPNDNFVLCVFHWTRISSLRKNQNIVNKYCMFLRTWWKHHLNHILMMCSFWQPMCIV